MKLYYIIAYLFVGFGIQAQGDDLLMEIDNDSTFVSYDTPAFKALKIINFETTKLVPNNQFFLVVSHRFGSVKNGFKNLFGLDEAVTHINLIYGLTDAVNLSFSRNSNQKIYELGSKFRILDHSYRLFPFAVSSYASILANTGLNEDNLPLLEFKHRLSYVFQVMMSRKINSNLSLQLSPTFFHDNYVASDFQDNKQFGFGIGGRYKFGKRCSFNFEYGMHLNRAKGVPFKNPLGVGFDLETGGHVFQLHFSNSQAMNINNVLANSTGDWTKGDFYFGFNLLRSF